MKQILLFTLCLPIFNILSAQTENLDYLLFELPDVIFEQIETAEDYEATYELKVKQALDHNNPDSGYFYQKVYLSHKGFNRPTVLVTEGYNASRNRIYELTELIEANQVQVEHRYFGESLPDSMDYNYLNLEQATADLHHIRELFSGIYSGKWISTGISKGGSTTIFYRYFYPEDVDVSVPYVAPINRSFEDKRIYNFLDNVGSEECREQIKNFQVRILENRDEIMPLLKFYNLGANFHYTYMSPEEAFELAVLEYPFSFWQYGHNCSLIPNDNAPIDTQVEYLLSVSDMSFYSDETIAYLGPHYYQSAEQMGYYGYEVSGFKKQLTALSTKSNPHATFLPNKMEVKFDGQLLKDVNKWLIKTQDLEFIYINGAIDTWSATAVPETIKENSLWFWMEGKHHANARIKEMNDLEMEKLITKLESWLSIEIEEVSPVH